MSSSSDTDEIPSIIARIQKSTSHYETLGVEKDCEEKVLKKAYRKLALQLHPDKCSAEGSEEAFKKVSNAYSCLSQADSRSHYDRFGSEAPAGAPGGGAGVDPNEFFREFMRQNPDFAAGFQAGGGGQGEGFNPQTFNFSAASIATGKSWWQSKSEALPKWLQLPFRALGVVVFAVVQGFFLTMPYSAMLVGVTAAYLASQAVWWIANRAIWLMALSNLPAKIQLPFFVQIVILVGAEYLGMVFDFQRGFACFLVLSFLNRFLSPPQQQQQRSSGFSFQAGGPGSSGFSFQTGPGFVQFGAMPNATRRNHPQTGAATERRRVVH